MLTWHWNADLERIENIEGQLQLLHEKLDSTVLNFYGQTSPSVSHSIASIATGSDVNASTGPRAGFATFQGSGLPIGNGQTSVVSNGSTGMLLDFRIRQPTPADVVSSRQVTEPDARLWFSAFFDGCDRYVPVFDSSDTFDSVRARSGTLFDIILIYGARATHGMFSRPHQRLYRLLREHTSDLVLRLSKTSNVAVEIEDIQALLVIASYSDSGGILCDIALQAALELGLLNKLQSLFSVIANHALQASPIDRSMFVFARVWYYLYVLDMILSIDGGKPPSVSMQSSPRRVRSLLSHPQRTALDIRLFAQVELNALRANAHASLNNDSGSMNFDLEAGEVVKGALIDLDLWLSEWQGIVLNDHSLSPEHHLTTLNLRIQHAWALLTLHLRALTATGIENIALMTDSQRNIAFSAKGAAEQHLQLLLSDVSGHTSPIGVGARPYVAKFRYAMEFVWAKNAFCVLIVLRLAILLGDPPDRLIQRLAEAKEFLLELDKIGMGTNVSYTRILSQTVEKCEKAVSSSLQSESQRNSAEPGDFQTFIPKEFMFEWDFPGLHLCYVPLDWQDLFLDFGATA